MEVSSGGVEAAMAQQDLDGPQIGAGFQQMSRKAVPERMHSHVLSSPAAKHAAWQASYTGLSDNGRPGTFPGNSQGPGW